MATLRRWVIGRAADCNVIINHTGVSGHHCCLTETEHGLFLEDLHSSNGTFVNGTKIVAKVMVRPTDRITLGQTIPMPWPPTPGPVPSPTARPSPAPIVARTTLPLPPPAPSASAPVPVMARTLLAPAPGNAITLTIGRAPDNDIRLNYPTVSGHHARIVIAQDKARIEDLGSSNGTAIGHPDRKITQAPLAESDAVFFGSLRVPASRLLTGKLNLGEQPLQTLDFRGDFIVFGRDDGCDQVLDSPMVSRRHARLQRAGTELLLEDLGSANGTFLNGQRIAHPVPVRRGDRIGLAGYTFTLNDAGAIERRNLSGNLALEARNLTVEVPGRRLLENVSLTIYPFELVGLMGPSGAGKTTLMNALNGYAPPTEGEVLLNGQSLYANYGQFASHLGYVPQDDIIHRELTVGQALYYTARLRLPPDFSDTDIRERVSKVIEQLKLTGTEDTLIGSPEKKGISGGQRKRVNLAMELLTDPLVLFLDEPTSGLSSEDALMVMQLLESLTRAGKTVLITIHQPSLEVFRLLTHLTIVSKDSNSREPGKLVYFGPAYPDAIRFFNPEDRPAAAPGSSAAPGEIPRVRCRKCSEILEMPDEVLRGLDRSAKVGVHTADWEKRYTGSEYHRKYVQERTGGHAADNKAGPDRSAATSFPLLQWWTLVRRAVTLKLRDRSNLAILLATAVTIALLVSIVFHKQRQSDVTWLENQAALVQTMFILSLGALWFGTSNAVREIVAEWAIYRRERMVNLKIIPYVASKFTVLGLLCLVQCLLLLGIAYWGCGLKAAWWSLFGLLVLTSLVGTALGLTFSAAARTPELAGTLFTWALLSMIILGGAVLPLEKMPGPVRQVCHAIPSRWSFEAMLVLEAAEHEKGPPSIPGVTPPGVTPKDMAEKHFKKEDFRLGTGVATGALAGLFSMLLIATLLILKFRDIH